MDITQLAVTRSSLHSNIGRYSDLASLRSAAFPVSQWHLAAAPHHSDGIVEDLHLTSLHQCFII